jgi:hypothetical protein
LGPSVFLSATRRKPKPNGTGPTRSKKSGEKRNPARKSRDFSLSIHITPTGIISSGSSFWVRETRPRPRPCSRSSSSSTPAIRTRRWRRRSSRASTEVLRAGPADLYRFLVFASRACPFSSSARYSDRRPRRL